MLSNSSPKLIVAVNPEGVIAVSGQIPWRKSEDMKRFKKTTMGGTLIMGRKTWESMGRRFLPGRRTVVLSRTTQPDVKTANSLEQAIEIANDSTWVNGSGEGLTWSGKDVWVIGGAEVYELAVPLVGEIDLTLVKDWVTPTGQKNVLHFRSFTYNFDGMFEIVESVTNPVDSTLTHCKYQRL